MASWESDEEKRFPITTPPAIYPTIKGNLSFDAPIAPRIAETNKRKNVTSSCIKSIFIWLVRSWMYPIPVAYHPEWVLLYESALVKTLHLCPPV